MMNVQERPLAHALEINSVNTLYAIYIFYSIEQRVLT